MPEMSIEQQKERVRRRIQNAVDPDSYTYTPAQENNEYARTDDYQRVAIYARVSTLNPLQTSSYELQQKYYEDLVRRYPKWTLYKIYADEGKSGVTTQQREAYNEMMADAMEGKFDLIIVKSISRLARNVVVLLNTVRRLAEKRIGVLFESEAVYSLNDTSHLALTFQATVAEEESRIRSRSMESSLRMRLDHGLPLTPELIGFIKDENGKLIVNKETENIPRLMFYMYLYGYSTQQIADTLTKLSKRTYFGNIKWSANGVARTLSNERYCGDVKTRKRYKVFAADVVNQKTFKNNGEKSQSYYMSEHDAIVSRDDFLAVQRIMSNAKYGGTSLLPELHVIPKGMLKGYVIVHPKWGSFTKEDYLAACRTVESDTCENEIIVAMKPGDFDLRGYDVADFKLFDEQRIPAITLQQSEIKFNMSCIRSMACDNYIELLVHPIKRRIAIRSTTKENRCAIQWTTGSKSTQEPRKIGCKAYIGVLFQLFGWQPDFKYKLYGCIYRDGRDSAAIFTDSDASVYIEKKQMLSAGVDAKGEFLNQRGKRIRANAGNLGNRFGQDYYAVRSMREMMEQTREEWQTRVDGQMCMTSKKLEVTSYDELRAFIKQELGDYFAEVKPE